MNLKILTFLLISFFTIKTVDEQVYEVVEFKFNSAQERSVFQNILAANIENLDIYAFSNSQENRLFILRAALINPVTQQGFQEKLQNIFNPNILNNINNIDYIP